MAKTAPEWLTAGQGRPPRLSWAMSTEAPLLALQHARETGEILAADESGGLYLIDRHGRLVSLTRGQAALRALAWSDTGGGGAALVGENQLYWFNRQLKFQGAVELPSKGVSIAVEQHGRYAAVSLTDGNTLIFDCHLRLIRHFQTVQPLISLDFLIAEEGIVGVAEYGLLCSHSFEGDLLWQEKLWANVGDMSLTIDGKTILLACFSHGIQCHQANGVQAGSFQVGGTASRVSASYVPGKISIGTLERHLYRLDLDGNVEWDGALPEDIHRLLTDPLGTGVVCGFQTGRIVRLDWDK